MKISFKWVVFGLLVFTLGFGISFLLNKYYKPIACTDGLDFIRPSIDCDSLENKKESFESLENKLRVLVDGYIKLGQVDRVGIFVRDLNTSRFFGINENDQFYMASLLKLPVMIGGFKLAEVEPRILDQYITYKGEPNLYNEQMIKPEQMLENGSSYKVLELMRRAVVYSDNTSAQILYDFYPDYFIDRVLEGLGIQITLASGKNENLITARNYASIFRALYNSSYLNERYSNQALHFLTETVFDKGVVSKLPKDVVVAHKFAERTELNKYPEDYSKKQLHECGIVYANNMKNPYTFCIFTEGKEYEELEKSIADISLLIYDSLDYK